MTRQLTRRQFTAGVAAASPAPVAPPDRERRAPVIKSSGIRMDS